MDHKKKKKNKNLQQTNKQKKITSPLPAARLYNQS
jgi:hypothetical protein